MENISPPEQQCAFISASGESCSEEVLDGCEHCADHVEAMTRSDVTGRVVGIICDELTCERHEVTEGARFGDDLNADSMEKTSLVMRMEEEFNFSIPNKKADRIQTVGELIDHVTDIRLAVTVKRPTPEAAAERRARNSEQLLSQIVGSARFRGYYAALGLEPEKVRRLFLQIVGSTRVHHVTPIEEFDEASGRLSCAHVLLLGEKLIYHFRLEHGVMSFEWAALQDLRLTYEMFLDGGGAVSRVIVMSRSRDALSGGRKSAPGGRQESLRDATFEFAGDQVQGALKFLSKYLANLGDAG